jgi:hypothetical protein
MPEPVSLNTSEPAVSDTDQLWKVGRYVEEIELYGRETQNWDRQARTILRRYKDDRGSEGTIESQYRRFNVLWSNTQNLLPALYARNPKPDVQRRFKDADPIGRVSSDVLERCLAYFCDTDQFAATSRACVLDYLLPGRGTTWVRYDPHFKPAEGLTDDVGPGDQNKSEALAPEVLDYEDVISDYVNREDYGHNICRTWDEVWLIWRKVYMTKREFRERFEQPLAEKYGTEKAAEMIRDLPMDYVQKDSKDQTIESAVRKTVIYEAWDKIKKCAIWFNKSVPDAYDMRPDPLRLDGFFPSPKPLFANLANDSLIPVPIYKEYQDQAAQLDELTNRIAQMTRCLKVVGVYDASAEGLNRMFNEGTENQLIPVQQWSVFAGEKGGMKGAMELLDIQMIAEALLRAYDARDKVKQDLDEITGMSDIIRGATEASETATAQRLKAGFAGQRISDHQRDVQRFIRETIRLFADVICNHFSDDTIKQISGVRLLTRQEKAAYAQAKQMAMQGQGAVAPPPLPPSTTPDQFEDMMNNPTWEDVFGLLRNNAMRCFRIDIETDSTIKPDEAQEKQDRTQFVQALGTMLKEGFQAGAQDPDAIPLIGQLMQFAVRAFPVGKELESSLSSYIQKKEKEAANPQPRPNPEIMKIQAEAQQKQAELQANLQIEQQKAQIEAQTEANKAQAQIATQQHLNQIENEREMQRLAGEQQLRQAEIQAQSEADQRKLDSEMAMRRIELDAETQLELAKAHIQQETAIEVARISAKATDGAQEEARAQARDDKYEGPVRDDELHAKLDKLTEAVSNAANDNRTSDAINNLAKAHSESTAALHKAMTSEKEIVRDPKTGKPVGVRVKQSNADLAKGLKG